MTDRDNDFKIDIKFDDDEFFSDGLSKAEPAPTDNLTDAAPANESSDDSRYYGMSLLELFEEENREEQAKREAAERAAREEQAKRAAAERAAREEQAKRAAAEKAAREEQAKRAAAERVAREAQARQEKQLTKEPSPAENPAPEKAPVAEKRTKKSKKAKKEDSPEVKAAKKTVNLATVALISLVFLITALSLVMMKRSTYSESERRPLASFPSFSITDYFSGKFTGDVTHYFTDTVPNRDALKDIAASIMSIKGVSANGVVIINPGNNSGESNIIDDDDDVISIAPNKTPKPSDSGENDPTGTGEPTGDSPATPTPTPTPYETTPEPTAAPTSIPDAGNDENNKELITIKDGGLVIYGTRCMEIFGGSMKVAKTYAANLNLYKEALGSKVNVYSMVIPVASALYLDNDSSRKDCQTIIDQVSSNLSDGVIDVPVFSTLDAHKKEYIYLRTDHHWAPLGAYYAWSEFAKIAKVNNPSINSAAYTIANKDNYLGSLYGYSNNNAILRSHPDNYIYYKPTNSYTVKYLTPDLNERDGSSLFYEDFKSDYYMITTGTNERVTEIHTNVGSGRTLVIVKDSFGNQLIPFAVPAFDNIYMVDARYFHANLIEFIQEKGATDVLFAACAFQVSSSAPAGKTYVDDIGSIRVW